MKYPASTTYLILAAMTGLISGCSSVKVWPFDNKEVSPQMRALANATEYQCKEGKHFYLRTLDNGNTIWLIYPDREISLAKTASSATRYSNGVATLDLTGTEATLTDGPAINYTGCKAQQARK
jgi:membrane-bound inhibitor of C-type lysozyme